MKIINLFISFVVVFSTLIGVDLGYGMNPGKKTVDLSGYELVWEDEFEGNELDKDKWNDNQNVDTIHWGEVRKGGYWHKDMIEVYDGNLHIKTKYVDDEKAEEYGGNYKAGWYTGYVTTYNSNPANEEQPDTFLYGYFETRCILPKGCGIWSAFWMMNGGVYNVDDSGRDGTEIDIFEGVDYSDGEKKTADRVSINLHWDGYNAEHKHYRVGKYYAKDPYNEYNTYGVKWTPNEYIFYINGHECARTDKGGVSQNPECLLLSVEIAGSDGIANPESGFGDITKNTEEMDFVVDYVRVYQEKFVG